MKDPLPQKLSFNLIWKDQAAGEEEIRKVILRKGRLESTLHIALKVLAYLYFWKKNLIIEPHYRWHRYRPDLISWRKAEIPNIEKMIPDIWVECKYVKLKKLFKLSRGLPSTNVYWIHTLQRLQKIVTSAQFEKKWQLAPNIQLIGIESSQNTWQNLEEGIKTYQLQWRITQVEERLISVRIGNQTNNYHMVRYNIYDLI